MSQSDSDERYLASVGEQISTPADDFCAFPSAATDSGRRLESTELSSTTSQKSRAPTAQRAEPPAKLVGVKNSKNEATPYDAGESGESAQPGSSDTVRLHLQHCDNSRFAPLAQFEFFFSVVVVVAVVDLGCEARGGGRTEGGPAPPRRRPDQADSRQRRAN